MTWQHPSRTYLHYGAAVAAVAIALGLTLLIPPLKAHTPFILFFPAVMVAAWFGGLGPALLATALSTMAAHAFILPQVSSWALTLSELVQLAVFVAVAVFMSSLHTTLRRERTRFAVTLASIGDAVIATDPQGRVTFMNPVAEALTGWRAREAMGKDLAEVFRIVNIDTREAVEHPVAKVLREGMVVGLANHTVLLGQDGTEHPIDDSGAPIRDADGTLLGVVIVFRDVTERMEAEQALRASEARFRTLTSLAPVGIFLTDPQGDCLFVNERWCAMAGLSPDEAKGQGWVQALHPEDRERVFQEWYTAAQTGEEFSSEYRFQRPAGQVTWLHGTAIELRHHGGALTGYLGAVTDITAQKLREAERETALREKEVLLKEIHHRVKNNLQVISSLLSLQSATAQHPAVDAFVQESERRIQAMALVHETLYQASDVALLDLAAYVRTLSEHLLRTYGGEAGHITLHTQLDEVVLSLDMAAPCGLMVSELLSNCLKHAFPDGQAGDIAVTLTHHGDRATLRVRDSGCGFPEHLDFRHTESLGLQLVCALTEQLQGTIALERDGGTAFTVTFPLPSGQGDEASSASAP